MALRLARAFVRFQVGDITGNFNYSTETIGREDESTWRIKRRNAKWKLYSTGREKDGWLEVTSYDTTKRKKERERVQLKATQRYLGASNSNVLDVTKGSLIFQ